MIDVIVNQQFLGFGHRAFDRLQLLSDVDARSMTLDHLDNAPQVTLGPAQALDDFRVRPMLIHGAILPGRIGS